MEQKRILVVGAGFAGAVVARELADAGHLVDVIDKRDHIAGNAYDYTNEYGITIHKYGPHLFHTNNEEVFKWLSRFTEWVSYKHRIKAQLEDGRYVPFPVNLNTMISVRKEQVYDIFFKPYSQKMWGKHFKELDQDVLDRVKVRDTIEDDCFTDKYQCMPKHGYKNMFNLMLNSPNIKLRLRTEFNKEIEKDYDHVFNSMAIDDYYDCCFGKLPYRSINFEHVTLPLNKVLPSTTVNFTHDAPYTRVTEWKQIPQHGSNKIYTTLTFEIPCENDKEKYYPVPTESNRELYKKYRDIKNDKVTFIGRCGMYVYMDMHMVVSSSLSIVNNFLREKKW
jgi:UDP-galactopyranose mutase